ncbi:MAG: exopolysaccharide biosynthesis polyprenyl glycosylphosphotransferase [Rhodospirillales bacterium]|nr:exopolysaccharide biosynthesis polyprenyl glycosylphosphotransferase [Acetobacter sp.]
MQMTRVTRSHAAPRTAATRRICATQSHFGADLQHESVIASAHGHSTHCVIFLQIFQRRNAGEDSVISVNGLDSSRERDTSTAAAPRSPRTWDDKGRQRLSRNRLLERIPTASTQHFTVMRKDRGAPALTTVSSFQINLASVDFNFFLACKATTCSRLEAALRRAMDLLGSATLLVFLAPLMGLVALAVYLDTPGPTLYRQERVGLHGRSFTLLKFRSMRMDAEIGGVPTWAASGDTRVTRVGGVIRYLRLDELPQLVNVLRGEMSMIGPRPERPHFVRQLAQAIPFYEDRHRVKPGITGWAQINYPYGASVDDARQKHAYDLYYLKHRSILLDLWIVVSTVRVILLGHGAR